MYNTHGCRTREMIILQKKKIRDLLCCNITFFPINIKYGINVKHSTKGIIVSKQKNNITLEE